MNYCVRCALDDSIPSIEFDDHGVCNYCALHDTLDKAFPNDDTGQDAFKNTLEIIKRDGKGHRYDCVIGVSGGTDSTYLLHYAKEHGLRPLAVHLDNGWNSEISVSNLKNCLERLDIDLITYVINWDEMKDVLVATMRASLPWVDGPTDIAILSSLYRAAARENIKYIFVGNNFRTEGKQPTDWTYFDGRMIKYIQKKYGKKKLKTFPNLTMTDIIHFGILRGVKMIRPFYYMKYNKSEAKKLVAKLYGWQDYGGHHHESIFTRFVIAYWLTKKFGIDKRKITVSALVRSGEMTRDSALAELMQSPYDLKRMEEDKEYVIKKLGLSNDEFEEIWKAPNKRFSDYPAYFPLYNKMEGLVRFVFRFILPWRPMMMFKLTSWKKI